MQIKAIEFDDEGDPAFVTMRLPATEVLYVAILTGKQSSVDAERVMLGGAAANHEVADTLDQRFVLTYFDDTTEAVQTLTSKPGVVA